MCDNNVGYTAFYKYMFLELENGVHFDFTIHHMTISIQRVLNPLKFKLSANCCINLTALNASN